MTTDLKLYTLTTTTRDAALDLFVQGPPRRVTIYDFIGTHAMITGSTGSGKSVSAAVLAEELLPRGATIAILDKANDFLSLQARHPMSIWGVRGKLTPSSATRAADACTTRRQNVILSLRGLPDEERQEIVQSFLGRILENTGINGKKTYSGKQALILFIDEAHNYFPEGRAVSVKALLSTGAILLQEGRKEGISVILITQSPAYVKKTLLRQTTHKFLHRVTYTNDKDTYSELMGVRDKEVMDRLMLRLGPGDAYYERTMVVPGVQWLYRVRFRNRHTSHAGGTPGRESLKREVNT